MKINTIGLQKAIVVVMVISLMGLLMGLFMGIHKMIFSIYDSVGLLITALVIILSAFLFVLCTISLFVLEMMSNPPK